MEPWEDLYPLELQTGMCMYVFSLKLYRNNHDVELGNNKGEHKMEFWVAKEVDPWIQYLPCKHEEWSSEPQYLHKSLAGVMSCCNPSTWETETKDPLGKLTSDTSWSQKGTLTQ